MEDLQFIVGLWLDHEKVSWFIYFTLSFFGNSPPMRLLRSGGVTLCDSFPVISVWHT